MKKAITSILITVIVLLVCGCSSKPDPAAELVTNEINELKESDTIDEADIEKAKERYNSLTDDQKKQVENYADLLVLEDEYYARKEELEAELKAELEYQATHYFNTEFLRVSEVVSYDGEEKFIEGTSTVYINTAEAKKVFDSYSEYDDQYDKIAEAELQIEDIRKRIQTIRSEQISGENVYQLLLAFDELYGEMDEPGKKELLRAIIERIDLFPEKREDGCWIRNIVFTFPVPIQGHEVKELPLEKSKLIETVVQLSKGNISSQNVRVEFSLEDMDMSRFQKGATYEQIQDWVQEKYGFHVTHLNIAHVKRKNGIIERENYNKPKSPDSRQLGCPDEKVKAIEDALRHFQMI